jgi:hypothetical protein
MDIAEMVALQEVDLHLDGVKRRLAELADQLREPDSHRTLSDETGAQRERSEAATQARQSLEAETDTLRAKIATEDGKLYSGRITDAKELRHLQEEVFALRRNLRVHEEQLLGRIDEEEQEQAALDYLVALGDHSRLAWDEHRAGLQSQHDQIDAEAARIRASVDESRAKLGPADLAVYDAQRLLQQVAVAAAVGGVCGACRLSLPTTILNRARRGTDVVNCPACDCIVYVH